VADPAALDPAVAGVLRRPFAQQVAFFRGKLGNLVPTARWTDMLRAEHDRGFMVAGAAQADLLADLAAAVDRSISEGKSIDAFRRDFRSIVGAHGWDYRGPENWRTRTIYGTNMRTSYAAGRNAQLSEGGFPFLMYKHGGSADPRPQHLAWDGLVLPANHEFWKRHKPPNDWGCSCYVVGLRSVEAGLRLGADPDKTLPEDWNTIDEKTGAPPGIGKGWDYAPGATVADTVATMADKTVQWEYALAKAYMENVPEALRDQLATAYRRLPSVADDARLYAQRVIDGRAVEHMQPYRTMGLLTSDQAQRVQRLLGQAVDGFDFALDRSAVKHISESHGRAASEALRGQRAVTAEDYARLPSLVDGGDIRVAGESGIGRSIVRVSRRIDGEEYIATFEVRRRRRMLALQSLWVRRG